MAISVHGNIFSDTLGITRAAIVAKAIVVKELQVDEKGKIKYEKTTYRGANQIVVAVVELIYCKTQHNKQDHQLEK